jgi:hypothetical protein
VTWLYIAGVKLMFATAGRHVRYTQLERSSWIPSHGVAETIRVRLSPISIPSSFAGQQPPMRSLRQRRKPSGITTEQDCVRRLGHGVFAPEGIGDWCRSGTSLGTRSASSLLTYGLRAIVKPCRSGKSSPDCKDNEGVLRAASLMPPCSARVRGISASTATRTS